MAGLKKGRTKKDSSSPNIVLVIFLVLFILVSIILGTMLYFSYDEKNKAITDATKKDQVAKGAETAMNMHKVMSAYLRLAMDEPLAENEKTELKTGRDDILTPDGGQFKNSADDKTRAALAKALKDVETDLGVNPDT